MEPSNPATGPTTKSSVFGGGKKEEEFRLIIESKMVISLLVGGEMEDIEITGSTHEEKITFEFLI
jgi:hypothetical protein